MPCRETSTLQTDVGFQVNQKEEIHSSEQRRCYLHSTVSMAWCCTEEELQCVKSAVINSYWKENTITNNSLGNKHLLREECEIPSLCPVSCWQLGVGSSSGWAPGSLCGTFCAIFLCSLSVTHCGRAACKEPQSPRAPELQSLAQSCTNCPVDGEPSESHLTPVL